MPVTLGEHLPGKVGRNRVRNGIVNVEKIELIIGRYFGHARGQRQIVGRYSKSG